MSRRILITGSREWSDMDSIRDEMCDVLLSWEWDTDVTVVHGGARGADSLSAKAAGIIGLSTEVHLADWDRLGKRAGFVRNAEMVNLGADICLAFFKEGAGNRGTSHCVGLARKAGIEVVEVWG